MTSQIVSLNWKPLIFNGIIKVSFIVIIATAQRLQNPVQFVLLSVCALFAITNAFDAKFLFIKPNHWQQQYRLLSQRYMATYELVSED